MNATHLLLSKIVIALLLAVSPVPSIGQVVVQDAHIIQIEGFAGSIIQQCIEKRIKGQDVDHLIEPFHSKNETWCWQSEFWGKWMLGATAAYTYSRDPELLSKMTAAVEGLLATQQTDGYIGNYGPTTQLTGWDIWGRKYSMLGLIRYHEISRNEQALTAAARIADHLIGQVGPDKKYIIQTGFYRGMASTSILEPIVYLYTHTGESRYLDFANYLVEQWESPEGPQLIQKAIDGVPVAQRFTPPPKWWSWENGQKAYEMMSCYDGLLELYKLTANPRYLEAVVKTADNIIETEINLAGSGSAFECWYGGVSQQTRPTFHTMETCVTTTWMKLCDKLLSLTGDPKYADHIERSFYNALMASMKYDASEIAKYSPLEGHRQAGEEQCNMHINCCNANGPRGFVMMPGFGLKSADTDLFVNYYGTWKADINLGSKVPIHIHQESGYPQSGSVKMEISPQKPQQFALHLRIPSWSQHTQVSVNGTELTNIQPGTYHTINREWKEGDQIHIHFDMRGRLHLHKGYQAVSRGPIVLARDSRLSAGFIDETAIIQHEAGVVSLTPTETSGPIWMAYTVPCQIGTDLEGAGKTPQQLVFCDFASAGNTWDSQTRYRVWISKTLHVMSQDYEGY